MRGPSRPVGESGSDNLRDELKEVVVAVGLRDSHRLLGCMKNLGMLLPSADLALVERAVSQLFDRFGDDTLVLPGHGKSTTLGAERPHLPEWRARGW